MFISRARPGASRFGLEKDTIVLGSLYDEQLYELPRSWSNESEADLDISRYGAGSGRLFDGWHCPAN
jgi:hypothetical protein